MQLWWRFEAPESCCQDFAAQWWPALHSRVEVRSSCVQSPSVHHVCEWHLGSLVSLVYMFRILSPRLQGPPS